MDSYYGVTWLATLNWIPFKNFKNQAIRLVDSNQHNIETSYKTLGIMKLHEAIKMENCKMMHKLEHNSLPGKLPLLFMDWQQR